MFPPGRARLATKPIPTGICSPPHDNGDRARRVFGGLDSRRGRGHDEVHLQPDQLPASSESVPFPCRPPVFDGDVLSLNPAEVA